MSVEIALHLATLEDLEKVHGLIETDIEAAHACRWDWDCPSDSFPDPYASMPVCVDDALRLVKTKLDGAYVSSFEDFLGSTMWTCINTGRTSDGNLSIGSNIVSKIEPVMSILDVDEQSRLVSLGGSIDFEPLRDTLEEYEEGLYNMMYQCVSIWMSVLKEGMARGKYLVITWG